ncbi:MbcA/ParS/Xre antitoxin family protein [Enterovirga rhinocerotis]|uniref:Uncharacterized protein DUF2384 n=1 Tax=Enterovirga rhinocerotis TaxID=1339210 RepID=A0A4R7BVP1_9HYPH|nr:MbcA/ParS/Xre antitoxin family protein [Enterovirga rhinocerotis]TDR89938.1 uncharacterized protein DUF2384 [Enterovirga rhinocerotis]
MASASIAPIPIRPSPDPAGRVTAEEARAMLRAVMNLFERWRLSNADRLVLLGSPSERTFQRWRKGEIGPLSVDTIHRLGDLLGIHKALRYMFTDVERGYAWIGRPNEAFGGRSALDVMRQGAPADIARIRAYLDAERGGW